MQTKKALVGALIATMLVTPVLAQTGEACLQHNRLKNWRAVDERTLVMTDIQDNRYTVEMQPRCIGVTHGAARLVFLTWENLRCLQQGDIINVVAPGYGRTTCAIASVHAGAPAAPAHS